MSKFPNDGPRNDPEIGAPPGLKAFLISARRLHQRMLRRAGADQDVDCRSRTHLPNAILRQRLAAHFAPRRIARGNANSCAARAWRGALPGCSVATRFLQLATITPFDVLYASAPHLPRHTGHLRGQCHAACDGPARHYRRGGSGFDQPTCHGTVGATTADCSRQGRGT